MGYQPTNIYVPKDVGPWQRFKNTIAESAGKLLVEMPARALTGFVETGVQQLFGQGGKMRGMFMDPNAVRAEETLRDLGLQDVRAGIGQKLAQTGLTGANIRHVGAATNRELAETAEVAPSAQTNRAVAVMNALQGARYNERMAGVQEGQLALNIADANMRSKQWEAQFGLKKSLYSGGRARPRVQGLEPWIPQLEKLSGLIGKFQTDVANTVSAELATQKAKYSEGDPQYQAIVEQEGLLQRAAAGDVAAAAQLWPNVKSRVFGWTGQTAQEFNVIWTNLSTAAADMEARGVRFKANIPGTEQYRDVTPTEAFFGTYFGKGVGRKDQLGQLDVVPEGYAAGGMQGTQDSPWYQRAHQLNTEQLRAAADFQRQAIAAEQAQLDAAFAQAQGTWKQQLYGMRQELSIIERQYTALAASVPFSPDAQKTWAQNLKDLDEKRKEIRTTLQTHEKSGPTRSVAD